jgi:hypothetical protein
MPWQHHLSFYAGGDSGDAVSFYGLGAGTYSLGFTKEVLVSLCGYDLGLNFLNLLSLEYSQCSCSFLYRLILIYTLTKCDSSLWWQ